MLQRPLHEIEAINRAVIRGASLEELARVRSLARRRARGNRVTSSRGSGEVSNPCRGVEINFKYQLRRTRT